MCFHLTHLKTTLASYNVSVVILSDLYSREEGPLYIGIEKPTLPYRPAMWVNVKKGGEIVKICPKKRQYVL